MKLAAAAALLVAGCWHDPPPAAPESPPPPQTATIRPRAEPHTPCEVAVEHVIALVEQGHADSMFTSHKDQLRAVGIASCQEMQWSEEALTCLRELPSIEELAACRERITNEQFNDVVKRVEELPP
jgi:hypothetical protein